VLTIWSRGGGGIDNDDNDSGNTRGGVGHSASEGEGWWGHRRRGEGEALGNGVVGEEEGDEWRMIQIVLSIWFV
jgi:hypothetical protein